MTPDSGKASAAAAAIQWRTNPGAWIACSPLTPWGRHSGLGTGRCPRCGWEAAARRDG